MLARIFYIFFALFGLTSASHVYKNVPSDCELRENRSESRTSPRGVDGILTELTLIYYVGKIWNISAYNAAGYSQASRKSAEKSSDLSLGRKKITFRCTPRHRDNMKVKHALVKSVYHIAEHTICNPVTGRGSRKSLFASRASNTAVTRKTDLSNETCSPTDQQMDMVLI